MSPANFEVLCIMITCIVLSTRCNEYTKQYNKIICDYGNNRF